jgi:hypothetical protein
MIPDRVFYPLAALVIAGLIGLALEWPQGQGAPSPAPFGSAKVKPTILTPQSVAR